MPLFECSNCLTTENTALCGFWYRRLKKEPNLCSECDPAIGKWHNQFPKIPAIEHFAKYPDAWQYSPAGEPTGRKDVPG